MKETKKSKIWMIIAIVAIVIILILSIVLVVNYNGSDNMKSGNNTDKSTNVEKNENKIDNKTDNVKIVESEASKITLEEYKTDNFTMKKPKGWTVETGGTGIFYTIRVYDPQNTNNQVYLMIKMQPLLKSASEKSAWQNYYNLSGNNPQYKVFTEAVVLDNPTTEGFYKKFNEVTSYASSIEPSFSSMKFPKFTNFTKKEKFESSASMKSVALDSKVLRATFTGDNSKEGEGLFMASIVNFGNQYNGGVDMGYYMIYDIMAITAEKDEFINYKDILLDSVNSIEFSDAYVKQTIDNGNAQTQQALALNASIQKSFDSYMSAWESRQKSYDIMSQKQSDATLGYERVYDTDTGDIYKAYNGFTDDYKGERYKSITDKQHLRKAKSMPIKYLKASGTGFFVEKDGFALAIRDDLKDIVKNDAFIKHMHDILEYRTMEYYRRRYLERI